MPRGVEDDICIQLVHIQHFLPSVVKHSWTLDCHQREFRKASDSVLPDYYLMNTEQGSQDGGILILDCVSYSMVSFAKSNILHVYIYIYIIILNNHISILNREVQIASPWRLNNLMKPNVFTVFKLFIFQSNDSCSKICPIKIAKLMQIILLYTNLSIHQLCEV